MKKFLFTLILTCSLITSCNNYKEKSIDQIKDNLLSQMPTLPKDIAIGKSPIDGVYEVIVGRKIFYVTVDGKYLLFGNIIDASKKKNLTEERVSQLNKINFKQLPLNLAITKVNGNGSNKLVIFSDPDCPYCQLFEKNVIPKLTDTTIYIFMYPLPMHPHAREHANQIWCGVNKVESWNVWMNERKMLPNKPCDTNAIDTTIKMADNIVQVEATPTFVLENGQIIVGSVDANSLQQMMSDAKN